jgi:hypothetical protein
MSNSTPKSQRNSAELLKVNSCYLSEREQFIELERKPDSSTSLQSPSPGRSDPTSAILDKLKMEGGFEVKVHREVKLKNLYRFLLAKVFYEEEGLHLDEYLVLWELHLKILELLDKDPSFKEKYQSSLEKIREFFDYLGTCTSFPIRFNVKDFSRIDKTLKGMEPLIPTRNAYFGLKKQMDLRLGFKIIFSFEKPASRVRDRRYVGVGYRDQGTRRKEHDGTPEFSEVASHFNELELRSEEEIQGLSRDDPEFDWNRLWRTAEIERHVSRPSGRRLSSIYARGK